jgi:hypothetical protein
LNCKPAWAAAPSGTIFAKLSCGSFASVKFITLGSSR